MQMVYKAILLESNKSNLENTKLLIDKYLPDLLLLKMFTNVNKCYEYALENEFHILITEIDIGNDSVFDLIENITAVKTIEVIVTSNNNLYALKAYKNFVTSYLSKPIDPKELVFATNKAKKIVALHNQFLPASKTKNKLEFLGLPSAGDVQIIAISKIIYFSAEGRYTNIYLKDSQPKLVTKNIGFYEEKLKGNDFIRIHNSYLINTEYIKSLKRKAGNYIELSDDILLPVAKRKLQMLYNLLGLK